MDSESDSEELGLESIQYRPPPKEEKIEKKEKPSKKIREKDVREVKEPEKAIVKKMSKNSKAIVSEEDIIKKRRMILMLHFYILEFPEELKSFKKTNFDKKTYEELIEVQKEMDFILGNNSGIASAVKLFKYGLGALELIAVNFTPINCSGLTEMICNDPDAMKDVKLIALKNCRLIQTEPEYRLAYRIVMGAIALNSVNPSIAQAPQTNDNINNINEKYKEI